MVNVKVTNNMENFKLPFKNLEDLQVYVGIPEENSSRKSQDEQINNAELAFILTNGARQVSMRKDMEEDIQKHGYHKAYDMYIQSHGSPLWQIPPRPIIQPAIEDDKESISELLKEAAKAILDGDKNKAMEYLNKAGLEGQAVAQDWFTDPKNGWAPNSPDTIRMKHSEKPNIDTGELRKAITYVIKEE